MPLRLPTRRLWRAAIYLVCAVLVVGAILMVMTEVRRSIRPGFDTTRIIKPVQDNGTIDYLTAIEDYFGRGVTSENNAAPLMFRAFGRQALANNQPEDGITNRLGIPHLPGQGDYFVSYEDYMKQHPSEDDPDPTSPDQVIKLPIAVKPGTEAWIKANEKPLAMLAEASHKSHFFIPFNGGVRTETLLEIRMAHVKPLLSARRAMITRALLRVQSDDFDGFRADLLTVMRWARLLASASTMIERVYVANRFEDSAAHAIWAVAASGKLTAEQARGLAQELTSLGELGYDTDTFNIGERFMVLDTLQALARAGPVHAGELINMAASGAGGIPRIEPPFFWRFVPIPYEDSMRAANHAYDGAMAVLQLPTYAQRDAALDLWERRVGQIAKGNAVIRLTSAEWLLPVFLPSVTTANRKTEAARVQARLAQTALALAEYRAQHAGYPVSLAGLVPANLPELPTDGFSGKPLIYLRVGDGYTLYSVGANLKDDGGKSEKPGDDLAVRAP
jgi:hypothetical protein